MNGQNDLNLTPNEQHTGTAFMAVKPSTGGTTTCHCDTASGAAFVEKYLHPPRPTRPEYAGIPDKNTTPSTRAEYKAIQQVGTYVPATTEPVSPEKIYPNILLIHTASPIAPVIVIRWRQVGSGLEYSQTDCILNPNINVQDMILQNASGRLEYKSTTSSLNATDFSNQGVVTCAQFRPNVSVYRIGDLIEDLIHEFKNPEREVEKLCQFYGLPYQKPTKGDIKSHAISQLGTAVENFAQILNVGTLPTYSTPVAMMSPNSTSTVATEGSFLVQKFDLDSVPYKDFPSAGDNGVAVSTPKGMPCYIRNQAAGATTYELQTINVTGQPGNTTTILADLPWFDMTWGYTLYEGLSVVAGASASFLPPYITVKCITGFAFQPLPDSTLSPFIKESAIYDFEAIRFVAMANHSLMDSLPAKANFWGSLGKMLLSAAPGIIDTVSGIFGKKRTDTEKNTTKATVDSLIKKIKDMETKLSKPKPRPQVVVQQQPARRQRRPRVQSESPRPRAAIEGMQERPSRSRKPRSRVRVRTN